MAVFSFEDVRAASQRRDAGARPQVSLGIDPVVARSAHEQVPVALNHHEELQE
ncbi:hypothetical protein [Tersicoccus phoenicis]|uniref:hypothetical protein n=1 Tax=Tersicoccus phoenicis TaxID=554083 RepID=UPI0013566685|nr:hypothetical protein [Tersicoccus phoenicis]